MIFSWKAMDSSDDQDDFTSDYAESTLTSEFTSVNTTRLPHAYEHGRRYQGFLPSRYGMPNDDEEQDREAIKHRLYVDYILGGSIFLAPIGDHPQKIVDLGTGFGYWAQDVAEKFPSSRVIGVDLSAVQPQWSPPNLEFRVEDLEDAHRPWTRTYADADLFHMRSLLQTVQHPARIIQRCFDNLKPGGWIECHEVDPNVFSSDGTAGPSHPLNQLYDLVDKGPFTDAYGWNLGYPPHMAQALRDAGFVNVQERHNRLPIGRWHPGDSRLREVGLFSQSTTQEWAAAMLANHDSLGLTAEEAKALGERIVTAFNDLSIHGQMDWVDVCGQKPE